MSLRIITHQCKDCGTIIAGNVLERNRTFKCSGLDCSRIHEFDELHDEEQQYLVTQTETYSIE